MRLVAVSRLLNESDIVEAFVRHTAHFVDHHIFVDNGSIDGTLPILENLKKEGLPITVYQCRARSFVEARLNTFLFQTAVTNHRADRVIFLDVDEFIDDRTLKMSLRETMASFWSGHSTTTCMAVALREYHMTPADSPDILITKRITQCSPTSSNLKVVMHRDLISHRPTIQPGNHGVLINGDTTCSLVIEPALTYAHFATRSPYQWISKSVIGWAKVLASGEELKSTGASYHYKYPFELMRDNPAAVLRDSRVMLTPATPPELLTDPIEYRGGPLKYTFETDYAMRAVRVLTQYLQELAAQHGELLKLGTDFSNIVGRNENGITRIL